MQALLNFLQFPHNRMVRYRIALTFLALIVWVNSLYGQQAPEKTAIVREYSSFEMPHVSEGYWFFMKFEDSIITGKYYLPQQSPIIDSAKPQGSFTGVFIGDTLKGTYSGERSTGVFIMVFSADRSTFTSKFYHDGKTFAWMTPFGRETSKQTFDFGKYEPSPIIAGLLSVVFPGIGQLYNGELDKAKYYALFGAAGAGGMLGAVIWKAIEFVIELVKGFAALISYYGTNPPSSTTQIVPTTTNNSFRPEHLFWGSLGVYCVTVIIATTDAIISGYNINSQVDAERHLLELRRKNWSFSFNVGTVRGGLGLGFSITPLPPPTYKEAEMQILMNNSK